MLKVFFSELFSCCCNLVGYIWRLSVMNIYLLKLQVRDTSLKFVSYTHHMDLYSIDVSFGLTHFPFTQPVVDAFDPRLLVCPPMCHVINFNDVKEEDLYEIDIPLKFTASVGTRVHGLACWFDVLFNGSTVQRWLTTASGAPTTHWLVSISVFVVPIVCFVSSNKVCIDYYSENVGSWGRTRRNYSDIVVQTRSQRAILPNVTATTLYIDTRPATTSVATGSGCTNPHRGLRGTGVAAATTRSSSPIRYTDPHQLFRGTRDAAATTGIFRNSAPVSD
ncbi:hypothetical protein V6N11_018702 [Hibiscus sabdariffa]|uniref:type I protein arginine methyltransferase n=1 Tax=Hibiscus sabdariffa TaxID=183260 RepID=A0ABR2QT19_9ROSI